MNLILLSILLWQLYPSANARAESHYVCSQAISIAISKIDYGLDNGYTGYSSVLKKLLKLESDSAKGILVSRVNEVINTSLNLANFNSDGLHYMPCLPTWSDFVTVAFCIFGSNAKSLYYLYMLLLTVSVLIFILSFRHNIKHLYLSLITIATFIVIINSPVVTSMSVVSHYFWTYLAIMPALYIAILFVDRHQLTVWKFLGALIQALILVFIIHVRNVAIYSFVFLFMVLPLYILIKELIKSGTNKALKSFIHKVSVWPLVLLLVCFIAMNIYKEAKLYPDYSNIKAGYPFWHMVYISLSAHPDACKKYNICQFSDAVAYKFVEKKMGRPFDDKIWNDLTMGADPKKAEFIVFFSPIYGDILKKEVIRIIMNDPWFFVSGFYYKIIQFPSVYLNGSEHTFVGYISPVHPLSGGFIPRCNLRWFLISMGIIGFFLVKNSRSNGWYGNFSVVFLMLLSSCVMLLLASPHFTTITDSAFTLTAMIFIGISILFYYIWYFIWVVQKAIKIKWCKPVVNLNP